MNTSTPDPLFLPQLASVLDRLDGPETQPLSRRDRLVAAAQQVCEAQQLPATAAQIEQAVDQTLTVAATPQGASSEGAFDFGWNRPTTAAALAAQRRQTSHRWVYLFYRINEVAIFLGAAMGAVLLPSLLYLWNPQLSFFPLWMALGVGFAGGGIGMKSLERWADRQLDRTLALAETKETPSFSALKRWSKSAAVRRHVRHCLISETPQLLRGDIEVIEKLIRAEDDRAWQIEAAEKREREQVALHQALVTMTAHD
jgi:hypothetical protein